MTRDQAETDTTVADRRDIGDPGAAVFVDTHVHLSHQRYAGDIQDVIARARSVGVRTMLIPAIDVLSIDRAFDLATRFDGLGVMAGLHPSYVKDATAEDFDRVRAFVAEGRVVAVGETGLDYYWDRSFDKKQHDLLRQHVRLALEFDLPLILHNREASDDLITLLTEERAAASAPEQMRGIFHCFSGPASVGSAAIELGFHLGVGGNITYKNSPTREAVGELPLESMVLETDGPFLAPVPYRGKRNEPSYVPLVAGVLAEAKGLTVEEVATVTTANAARLFGGWVNR